MRSSAFLVALSGLVASVVAQNSGTSGTNFTINVQAVPLQLRANWCRGQRNVCDELCPPIAKTNTCNQDNLEYSCLCQNGSAPGLQYYSQSLPTFICQQAFQDCTQLNVNDKTKQTACTTDIWANCGTLSSASTTTTTSATTGPTESAATGAPSTTSSRAAAAATNVALLGNGIAVAAIGLFAYLA